MGFLFDGRSLPLWRRELFGRGEGTGVCNGETSVTELEELLSARQAAVSQQLSRLRLEGLVTPRREGKAIYYRLADDRPRRMLEVVYELFCGDENS